MANDGTAFRNQYKSSIVAKVELGTKRQCPKCGARFYDLGNYDPITCIECEEQFVPEILLKARRPAAPAAQKIAPPKAKGSDSDDLESDDEELLAVDDDDNDEDDEIAGILSDGDDSIEDELGAEVVVDSKVSNSDEK